MRRCFDRFRIPTLAATAMLLSTVVQATEDESRSRGGNEAAAVARRIDELIAGRWKESGIEPAPLADDAEFLRRVHLDIVGKIPSVWTIRTFLEDPAPDKRARLVDRLLDGPGYVRHFTTVWRQVLMSEANANLQVRFLVPGFEAWLRKELVQNVPYDQMVREILTAPLPPNGMASFYQPSEDVTPVAFYHAKQLKPEGLASASARIFLGLRVECAQCHDHPLNPRWKQDHFWSFAAFFGGMTSQEREGFVTRVRDVFDRRELEIPGTQRVVQARYLDGSEPQWRYQTSARQTLSEWLAAPNNPYFARAAVNRMWAHFFGTGIVDPPDDFDDYNPPSHPEVLDELARSFVEHGFDMKFLIRAMTATQAYQLTSNRTHPSQDDPRAFARMAVRGLSAEQLFDSLAQATGFRDPNAEQADLLRLGYGSGERASFLDRFANHTEKPTEPQTTILQALALMNGDLVAGATNVRRRSPMLGEVTEAVARLVGALTNASQALAATADAPFLSTAGRVEVLFLAALSRKPTESELKATVDYVQSGGPNPPHGLGDVFWALLNSTEFRTNH